MEQSLKNQVRQARSKFIAMAATYFLGVFNDNFFKQAVLLLAVFAGKSGLQGQATELFSLPFILFSAYAGWLADRYTKRNVVIGVKFLELAAMLIGAYGIITLQWNLVLTMVFLMGLQSTLFGPALNGSIPELYPAEYVTKANAFLKLITTAAILIGMALAGIALDQEWIATVTPFGQILVACVVVTVALAGVIVSFGGHKRTPVAGNIPFPWTGPLASLRESFNLRKDPLLLLAVCCDVFFYFISLLVVLIINTLGLTELELSKTITSLLAVALMVGVCVGSLVSSRITSSKRWTHVLIPSAIGMGCSLIAVSLISQNLISGQLPALIAALAAAGICGGIFLIPVASFIQVRPKMEKKGRIIAASNFCAFSGMWLAGRIFTTIDSNFSPSLNMMLLGVLGILAGVVIFICRLRIKENK